ncbi:MAG: hypothetical protein HQL32_14480 [Planctomycetes bacterium]|nr:hypothetical protein [Planctomycetota bacterium]
MLNENQIRDWLKEDIGSGDITTEALISEDQQATAKLVCKEDGVIYGLEYMEDMLKVLGHECNATYYCKKGDLIKKGQGEHRG